MGVFLISFRDFTESFLLISLFLGFSTKNNLGKEKSILAYISDHPGTRSGTISAKLGIPVPTVKRLINNLFTKNLIERFGTGPGTNYSIK